VPGEAPSPTWELFGHLVMEDTTRAGRYSVLRCVRCGTEVSLLDLKTLREKPCVEDREKDEAKQKKAIVSLTRECENCGREATASLCDSCAVSFEKYAEAARPIPPGPPGREWRGDPSLQALQGGSGAASSRPPYLGWTDGPGCHSSRPSSPSVSWRGKGAVSGGAQPARRRRGGSLMSPTTSVRHTHFSPRGGGTKNSM
jgi:ribosomal protein S14